MKASICLTSIYESIRSLPVGTGAISETLNMGQVIILVHNSEKTYSGKLNKNGVISGLSKLFCEQNLKAGMFFEYENHDIDSIKLYLPQDKNIHGSGQVSTLDDSPSKKLKWFHNEVFYPDNLERWVPNAEPDVYIAFGALQEYTDYSYCGAVNKEILSKLEYFKKILHVKNKPDAILRDKKTDEYLIAEFKMKSSDYKKNHKPNDVDVLVVWRDDETDRSNLPKNVVELYKFAKIATLAKAQS